VSNIQKVKRSNGHAYRVLIRRNNRPSISKTFPTKILAQQFSIRKESELQSERSIGRVKPSTMKLSVLIELYLRQHLCKTRPKEQRNKLQFWDGALEDRSINEISGPDIANALDRLPSKLSNATRNRYKAAISVVFAFACNKHGLSTNPVQLIPFLPENNARIRFLSNEERSCLFEACRASKWDKLYLIVLMAITTGARKGELMSLEWSDIDLDRQTAFVKTSKNGEPKVLPLTDSVIKELVKYKEDNGLLFPSKLIPNKPYCFTKPWYKALKEADVEDFRFHDLRHSCASYLAMNGASLLEIADVLGHKQIQMTKRYAHLCIDHKQRLINKVMGGI